MINEFMSASLPWIILGLFTAISCAFFSEYK